jgi:hypothetical protein
MKLCKHILVLTAALAIAPVHAAKKKQEDEVVEMSGISIIGNRELPKTLFIVPWKSSEVGVETELTNTLNEGMQPLDREVFERELDYYEFSRRR